MLSLFIKKTSALFFRTFLIDNTLKNILTSFGKSNFSNAS